MYRCGQQVVYGAHGVCRILDKERRSVDRRQVEYYVLEPLEQPGARYYIPTQNPAAVAKLRPLISRKTLDALLSSESVSRDAWLSDENQRKQRYRELISSGDREALLAMVCTLHRHRAQLQAAGRKPHLCDENFLRDAQKLLSAEFAVVLNIRPEEVGPYIQSKIAAQENTL